MFEYHLILGIIILMEILFTTIGECMNTSSNEIWQNMQNYKSFELREHRFRKEMLPVFYYYLGISPHSSVLDGGCGTGVFTRYLASGLIDGKITGFDINKGFIEYGKTKIKELSLEEKSTLEVADGFNLHYADNSFDAVTNYTYIGVLSDPVAGLAELIRVCKVGGMVSCVVASNSIPTISWQGDYLFDGADKLQALTVLENSIFTNFACSSSDLRQSEEWHGFRYPKMFETCGLKNIHIYPMAHIISYSDTQYPLEYRRVLVNEEIKEDMEWITSRYQKKRELYHQHGFGDEDLDLLLSLLAKKAEYLTNNLETDKSFEWHGGFNFIVAGTK
jgi:ubiquinone/menaquinone biosynthesis C-methylase UbiE